MKRTPSALPECVVIEPRVFADERGCFFETWNHTKFSEAGLDFSVAQANVSVSQQGVLRGLHYQWPNPQGKLVSVLEGEVYDVAVDIRRGSPRFGQWAAVILSAENRRQFWIPEGFAHGFVTLSERAVFSYLCTREYDAAADANIRWDDASLAIDWPIRSPSLSPKDAAAPFLAEVPAARLPMFGG
ncbi:MAG: dTDP-4-dehydrorhamnose 3,5-epimerase [Xanthomonadaceae bacterium]|nr:dTDP-4-dehydrorhamnose 3,5-epimerase [Xanthomonadaceae bacterium]MDZ4115775.1 dTDP-4-dehydrorhamnose 3,5-epimerase [Xanthomonadaceae bacterium]